MNVLTHLWQSTVVAGLLAVLALAWRSAPARWRSMLWTAASLKFLVPFAALSAVGRAAAGYLVAEPSVTFRSAASWLDLAAPAWTPAAVSTDGLPRSVALALAATWLCGTAAIAVSRFRTWRWIEAVSRDAAPVSQGREHALLQRAIGRLGLHFPIELRASAAPAEPMIIGTLRPRIVWPAALSSRLSDEEVESILAHEVCHARRRDNAVSWLHVIVETLFWFHPAVWWIGSRAVDERERACDEEVVTMGIDKQHYASSIIEVCRFCLRVPAVAAAGIAGSNLPGRVERIMLDRPRRVTIGMRLALAATAVMLVALPVGAGVADASRPAAVERQSATKSDAGSKTVMPRIRKEVKPVYTEEAKKERIQGSVQLQVVIEKDGTVGDVRVTKSLDTVHGLDDEAIKAVRQWLFYPGTKDGDPVAVTVDIEMTFTLK